MSVTKPTGSELAGVQTYQVKRCMGIECNNMHSLQKKTPLLLVGAKLGIYAYPPKDKAQKPLSPSV